MPSGHKNALESECEYRKLMKLIAYRAKLFARELTRRSSADHVDKLASAFRCPG
jgi:hypothetical protein